MATDQPSPSESQSASHTNALCTEGPPARKPVPAAAARALAEAAERRRQGTAERDTAPEIGGRGGLDPSRYDDWEIKGRAIDF